MAMMLLVATSYFIYRGTNGTCGCGEISIGSPGRCLNLHGCLQVATENGFVEVVELLESEASLVRNDGKLRRFSEYKEF